MVENNLNPLAYEIKVGYNNCLVVAGCVKFADLGQVTQVGAKLIASLNEVKVDIGDLTDFDSGILAMLLEWQRIALSSHKKICFYNAPKSLLDLGRVYGLDVILNFKHGYVGKD